MTDTDLIVYSSTQNSGSVYIP